MGKWRLFLISWVAAIAAMPLVAAAVPFTNGNVVVVRSGDDTYASADGAAVPAYLDEYTLDGTLVQSIPMGDYADAVNPQFTLNGGNGNGGFISKSYDGNYLVMAGYDAPLATPGVASTASTTYARTVARIDLSGNIDTTTKLTDLGSNEIRSAASVDGTQFWAVGTGTSNRVRYASLGATTSSRVVSSGNSLVSINIFKDSAGDAQLFASRNSSSSPLYKITRTGDPDPKLPVGDKASATSLYSLSGASGYDYFFLDANTLYITDDNNSAIGGVQKWTSDGTTWTQQYVLQAGLSYVPLRGLSGSLVNINGTDYPVLVATDGNGAFMYSLVDSGAGASWSMVAQAPENTRFQDVVVPYALLTPEPTSLLLLGLAGLFCLRRRRRA
jgi:hypothetical protein